MERPASRGGFDLDEFVDANLISFAVWDLLVYLDKNPSLDATLPQLCSALTRTTAEMERAVGRLTESGVLEVRKYHEDDLYRLAHDPAQRRWVARFAEAARDRGERLALVRHVMGRLSI